MSSELDAGAPPFARLVLAPNPGPMTLDGTNTWVLGAPGAERVVVIDPGPDDRAHLDAVAASGEVALIVLTHGHLDHSAGAPAFRRATGAPVTAFDPRLCRGAEPLHDGVEIEVDGLHLRVLATPGHSGDSLTFIASVGAGRAAVLTGDTLLGRGSTVVAHPDGRLDDYLASLRRVQGLGSLVVLPGHGPVRRDVSELAGEYLAHRAERLDEVRAALARGAETVDDVLDVVYADVDPQLRFAAAMSVRAQLDFLRAES